METRQVDKREAERSPFEHQRELRNIIFDRVVAMPEPVQKILRSTISREYTVPTDSSTPSRVYLKTHFGQGQQAFLL